MTDLPSTTHINPPKKISKEAFYRHLQLSGKIKNEFVKEIEFIQIIGVVKPSTMNILDGELVHEIDLLEIGIRGSQIPKLAIEAIARTNAHKLLFICSRVGDFDGTYQHVIWRNNQVWEGPFRKGCLGIHYPEVSDASTLDELWENTCARIMFDDDSIEDVDGLVERNKKTDALAKQIEQLEKAHAREKQLNKRNNLFRQLKQAKREYQTLTEGQ